MKRVLIAASIAIAASLMMSDTVLAKGGGHGGGRGHGAFATSHSYGSPPGWHHGRKVGWRGGCPPGLWKQGRC